MNPMKVTMIGMGAVGAVVGRNLNEFLGKENLQCIAEGKRLERYRSTGISINGKKIVTIHHKKFTKNRHYPLFKEIQM